MMIKDFSIVPADVIDKDPRPFAYMYPEMIRSNDQKFIGFIKKMQRFSFYQSVLSFENFGKQNGMILLPSKVLHWRRRAELGEERRVKVGRCTFYFVKGSEVTDKEQKKLFEHVEDIRGELG